MSPLSFQSPVKDSVQKVNNEVAVGEDLAFQEAWWRFERVVWTIFLLIIVCDVAGVFGRGPVAHTRARNDQLALKYDRIGRYGTPSILDVAFDPSTATDGKYHLFVSDSLVKDLGAQRVIPSPETTFVGSGGFTYVFPATPGQATAQFALQPSKPGVFHFSIGIPGANPITGRVVVMP